jgi:phosphoribosylformylglycinamidine cyclo-ligase
VLGKYLAGTYPESFDPEVNSDLVYSGSRRLTDPVEGTSLNVGQLVLSPTRTYAPVAKALLDELRPHLHGMVHCSGGAQTKVLHFIDNLHVIKDNLLPIPPLFRLIQAESGTSWQEMYQVFNMGHRLEVYLPEAYAQRVVELSRSFGIEAQVVGRVEAAEQKQVTVRSEVGEFVYR